MLTVGMLKEILNHIPDDTAIRINDDNSIVSHYIVNEEYHNKSKEVLNFKTMNLPQFIIKYIRYNIFHDKFTSLDTLIYDIENNVINEVYQNNPLDFGWDTYYIIDDNLKNVLICKLQDNYQEIKELIKQYVDSLKDKNKKQVYSAQLYRTLDMII